MNKDIANLKFMLDEIIKGNDNDLALLELGVDLNKFTDPYIGALETSFSLFLDDAGVELVFSWLYEENFVIPEGVAFITSEEVATYLIENHRRFPC